MPDNKALKTARENKKDEFYTSWSVIEQECEYYIEYNPNVFKNKVILLPCDDPFESNFFKYFALHFNDYGLKKLIATSYSGSPIVNTQLSLFDEPPKTPKPHKAYKIELNSVSDFNNDQVTNLKDVETLLNKEKYKLNHGNNSKVLSYLKGDPEPDGINTFPAGDFRSREVTKLRNNSDMIITNPPFSLFRDFVKWINPREKKMLIIGNINAVTYKDIFPLLQNNIIWLGASIHSGDREFRVPDDYPLKASTSRIDKEGHKYIRVKGVRWFTNLDHGLRHEPLSMITMKENIRFSNHKDIKDLPYAHYVNFDAIEVPHTDSIPSDYKGVMGVPITFLDKYDPDQFEILGMSSHLGTPMRKIAKKGEFQQGGQQFYTKRLIKKDIKKHFKYHRCYDRLAIRAK